MTTQRSVKKTIRVIGVPIDLGQQRRGVDLGPQAIRYAGLHSQLRELGYELHDVGNMPVDLVENTPVGNPKMRYLAPILQTCQAIAEQAEEAIRTGEFCLTLGGDHSLSLGSISGVAKAQGEIGVIWVDAHGDFNTDETTPSGNVHGMPLAALAGLGNPALTQFYGFSPKVPASRIAIVGARSIDPGERLLLKEADVLVHTMADIDRRGMASCVEEAIARVTAGGKYPLHLSFDLDSIDPSYLPGTGTTVVGGLTYREAQLTMEIVAESGAMISLDIAELNPILDIRNQSGELAVELILSAFGKMIL